MNSKITLVLLGLLAISSAQITYKFAQLLLFTDDKCGTSFQSASQIYPIGCTPPSVFVNGTSPGTDSFAAATISCTATTVSITKCETDCGRCASGTQSYNATSCNPFPGAAGLYFKPLCLPSFPILPIGQGQISSFTQYASSDCSRSSLRGWFVGVQPFCYSDSLGYYSSVQCTNGDVLSVSECPNAQCSAGANQTCLTSQTKQTDYKCIRGDKVPGAYIASCGVPYASEGVSSNAVFAPFFVIAALISSFFF
eukprot:TRINITY_DN13960_c0_g1_i1.p1 TRINITY_DN13960_c0_g1~~TRINITY_DN13960_c0_g1_i1.p1  ORF type:complete len:276 (+),score=64.37 TRINITY_DN13960_c0_g1_i1:72-830(+)